MERLPSIKWIVGKAIWVLEEKGWEGGKNKDNLGRMKQVTLRILRVGLADV